MTGFVLTVGGEKGGPGKSTIATNLAALLVGQNIDTCLVNTDRQETARFWTTIRDLEHPERPRVHCVTLRGKTIHEDIRQLAKKHDAVIVDAAGQDSVEQRAALVVTDRLLIPVRPSQFDIWTLERMSEVVEQARAVSPDLDACLFGNQVQATNRDRDRDDLAAIAADHPELRLLKTVVIARVSFQRSASQGLAVTEMDRVDVKARTEILSLYEEAFEEAFENGKTKARKSSAA